MRPSSLRVRLIAGGILAIVLALALAGAGLLLLFERHVERTMGEEIEFHVGQLIAGIDLDADGLVDVTRPPSDPRFGLPLSGLYWQVQDDQSRMLRSRSLWDTTLTLPRDDLAPGDIHFHRSEGPNTARVLVIERKVQLSRGADRISIRIAVATDLARASRAASAFTRDLVLALCLLALVLGVATAVQVGLGLQPLDMLRRQVAGVRSGRTKLLPSDVPVEVHPLVEELNALLTLQEKDIERSRGRAADLAHGLKTPLAALSADVARLRALGQVEIATDIEHIGDAMNRHVDRELARARVRGAARRATATSTKLAPLVATLVATVTRAIPGKSLTFEQIIPDGVMVPLDRTDLAEVLGNLLENAARHARAEVRISACSTGGSITIENDGEDIPADLRASMLVRGQRLDTKGKGAGLGLAIVLDVLEAYGWTMSLDSSELGGLKVTLCPGPVAGTGG